MQNILELIDKKQLFEDFEYLGSIPETGFDLVKTKQYVKDSLISAGIDVFECGRCGLGAVLGKESLKKTILLRADMDALAIQGKGNMHACGHHMHTAMLLGAARVIKKNESNLSSRVKLMFQSAEEILEGARDMIKSGILDNPKPDAAFMIHVTSGVDIPAGTVVFASEGDIAPSADYFTIRIKGKGCHGAVPSEGIDPVTCSGLVITALANINSRELPAFEPATITIGSVHCGDAPNAITDEVILRGTVRTYNESIREFVKERINKITDGICTAMRCEGIVSYEGGCPSFLNNGDLLCFITKCAKDLLEDDRVVILPKGQKGGGSEDFAYVSREVPTVMASLSAGERSKGFGYPLHNPNVTFDKSALPVGSALMAAIAFSF